jgi:pimeloyl-ACP methyl ester carboxylesterase
MATASPKVDSTIRLSDGRRMAYSEWGDLGGRPVVLAHGGSGSRLLCPDGDATEAAGVRLITIDRPGYGLSELRTGRTLLDWVDDFVELADRLDISRCAVVGWSGGAPFALALGFRLPNRVTTLGFAAPASISTLIPGIAEAAGWSAGYRADAELFARDPAAGLASFEERYAWISGDGWEALFDEDFGAVDDRLLADPEIRQAMKTMVREGARQGAAGRVADEVVELSPMGFSVTDITQPVHVWSGALDGIDIRMTVDYLVHAIPRATLITYPDGAHLFPFERWAEMLATLLEDGAAGNVPAH